MKDQHDRAKTILSRNVMGLKVREGLSEMALQKKSGVSQRAINNLLNGVASPTLLTLCRIADAFGVEVRDLLDPDFDADMPSGEEWREFRAALDGLSDQQIAALLRRYRDKGA